MSANSQAVRRDAAHGMRSAAPVQRPGVRTAPAARSSALLRADGEDEFVINLGDIELPRTKELEVDGLKPSLLSRFFNLFSPIK
jgi:hypothetical protein